ncbi:MAG: noncanonical pyrimidine nucleotidase, YjjG family [Lachnospiraceae bacterium]|jgi:2-haloacid dehalogenase|nr:noncanonical pyrimidine nucleotidase, YjjG family [Lachnospiraceae bacterium]
MITTLFLDLDETIFDFKLAQEEALKRAFAQFDLEPKPEVLERYDAINKYVWQLLEEQKATREEILVMRFRMLLEEYGIQRDAQALQDTYEEELGVGHFYLPGAKDFLDKVKGKYQLYLVSNGTASVQDSRIGSSDLSSYLDDIFVSETVGADKPSIAFFERCFAKIPPFLKEEAVIIGDSLTSDIRGGLNAGLHTIWFNHRRQQRRADIVPEYEACSYDEILQIIEQI